MEVENFDIEGLLLIKPSIFRDDRGYFFESFNREAFKKTTGLDLEFVQDNESASEANVVRGLHLQLPPFQQGKLVRVTRGKVFDVAVDVRKDSKTYGQYVGVELNAENKYQFYIPPGFAHGFSVLEPETIFAYKCTGYYNRESERAIRWDDPEIGIDWGVKKPIISEKDQNHSVFLKDFNEAC